MRGALVFNGYIIKTGHWSDSNWSFSSSRLTFKSYPAPHKPGAVATIMKDSALHWNIENSMRLTMTNNAVDMVAEMRPLHMELYDTAPRCFVELRSFRVYSMKHFINTAILEFMVEVHERLS